MADQTWWVQFLQPVLWFAVMSLVMGWVARSRFRSRAASRQRILEYPPSTLVIGLSSIGMFGGMAVLTIVAGERWWLTAFFAGFALMGAPYAFDYFVIAHQVSEEGIVQRRRMGGTTFIRWTDVRRIRYGQTMKWFLVETHGGHVLRLSVTLMGLPEFAEFALAHAAHAIDGDALAVVEATADGTPPSVWG